MRRSKFVKFPISIWNNKSILQILYASSVSWKIISIYYFSLNILYFAQKGPIKMKVFETFKCSGKYSQIPYANFETSRFLYKFYIPLQFHERTTLYFFWLKKYILCSKGAHSNENFGDFRVLRSNIVKFFRPILKWRVNSSTNFLSIFSFMKDNSGIPF